MTWWLNPEYKKLSEKAANCRTKKHVSACSVCIEQKKCEIAKKITKILSKG